MKKTSIKKRFFKQVKKQLPENYDKVFNDMITSEYKFINNDTIKAFLNTEWLRLSDKKKIEIIIKKWKKIIKKVTD